MTDLDDAWALLRSEATAWAIHPAALNGLAVCLARGERPAAARSQPAQSGGSVAVVSVAGPLVRRGGMLSRMFGLTSYDDIKAQIGAAVADKGIGSVLLWTDSPGGVAGGAEEVADVVARAARIKPVRSWVDGTMASAALWIGSASQITASPSSEIGSLGVLAIHQSIEGALQKNGIEVSVLVSSVSPHKAELSPFAALSDDARAQVQKEIDAIANRFVRDVARGRGVGVSKVKADFGRGRTMVAADARAVGLIDVVGSIEDAVRATPQGTRAARLDAIRQESIAGERDAGEARGGDTAARRRRLELLRS